MVFGCFLLLDAFRSPGVLIPKEKPPVKSAKSEASTETAATAATSAPGRSSMGSGLLGSAVKSLLKHFDSKAWGVWMVFFLELGVVGISFFSFFEEGIL